MNHSQFRSGRLVSPWILVLACLPSFAAGDVDVAAMRKMAAEQGEVALGQFREFQQTYLADVTIQAPRVSSNGSLSGTTTLAGEETRVLLQYIESNEGLGRWLLAMKLPLDQLGKLAPAVRGTPLDQVQLANPILVFATQGAQFGSDELAPEVRNFYSEVYGTGSFDVHIEDGVNLLTGARAQAEIRAGAEMLGLDLQQLVLEGVILKNFDAEQLKAAKQEGRLLKAMGRDAELRGRLTGLEISGLPRDFHVRDLAFLVTGQPRVGLEFYLTVGSGSNQRDFRCRASFESAGKGKDGRHSVSISAKSDVDQPWRNALGIEGLEMQGLTMELRYERNGSQPPAVNVGVLGEMKFGDKFVAVAGGLKSRSGATFGFFKGNLNRLNRNDLVAVVNDLHAATSGGRGGRIDPSLLPDFELRQVEFNYAPLGGSEELGIESGIGMKGELYLFGSRIASADVLADATQSLIRIDADVNEFSMGELALRDSELNVRMANDTESYFRFRGGAQILGVEATAEANIGVETSRVRMTGKLADAWEADLLFRTPTIDQPVWEFEAALHTDAHRSLGTKVAQDLRSWAEKTRSGFESAQSDLDRAKREVQRIDSEIRTVRARVQSEREIQRRGVTNAQRDVQKINSDIANMRQQVESERNRHRTAIQSAQQEVSRLQSQVDSRRRDVQAQRDRDLAVHRADMSRVKKAYDSAEKAYQSARSAWKKEKNPIKKVKKGVTKDARGVARDAKKSLYYAARKKYDLAKGALDKVSVDADPKIVALNASKKAADTALQQARRAYDSVTRGLSVDADPRIVGLFAARDTAMRGLKAAERAFALAHRIPVDADPRLIGLFAARKSANAALDAAKLTVSAASGVIDVATEILAATAEGQVIAIEEIKLHGKVDIYDEGGEVAMEVRIRLVEQPAALRLAVAAPELSPERLARMITDAALAKLKSLP